MGCVQMAPALLTRMSRRPNSATVRSIRLRMASSSRTSVGMARARRPVARMASAVSWMLPGRRSVDCSLLDGHYDIRAFLREADCQRLADAAAGSGDHGDAAASGRDEERNWIRLILYSTGRTDGRRCSRSRSVMADVLRPPAVPVRATGLPRLGGTALRGFGLFCGRLRCARDA